MIKYILGSLFFINIIFFLSHKSQMLYSINKFFYISNVEDTTITYTIEGISAEGADSKVHYINDIIYKSVTNIYGETGKVTIIYNFDSNIIKVLETKYTYKTTISKVKINEDMNLDYQINYIIDFNGKIIGKEFSERIDIFQEFIKIVPFKIK